MGNINLYKSTNGQAPWSLVKENIQNPVTITESTGGSVYYAVRDEGDGANIEPSEYKIISKPVYVFKSTDKVSKITFDDTTDLNSLIVKVTSTCGNTSNHKVQVQINVKNTGWKNFAQVAIGSNIQAKYTTAATDGVTEGSQIKFRAYIFNTTNTNYRTNNSAEYVYTVTNIDISNITVNFSDMDENYYYLHTTRTDISSIDTPDGIQFIDINDFNIRLKDTGYLRTQIYNLQTNWTFSITIYLTKLGIQKSVIKSITIPNNLFSIRNDGNISLNYNMIVNDVPRDKGQLIYTSINSFRLAGSDTNNGMTAGKIDDVCGSGEGAFIAFMTVRASKFLYYVSIGDAYKMCADGNYYCIDSAFFTQVEVAYDRLSGFSGSSVNELYARLGISMIQIPSNMYYCVGYAIF